MGKIFLNNCLKNNEYIIESIDCKRVGVARRLSELGFYVGAKLRVSGYSALRKTLLVEIEGYTLSLRSNVAENVTVRQI